MSDIRIKSSIAFEAVCFLEKREQANIEYLNSKQIDEINYINSLLPPADEEDCTGMSCIHSIHWIRQKNCRVREKPCNFTALAVDKEQKK